MEKATTVEGQRYEDMTWICDKFEKVVDLLDNVDKRIDILNQRLDAIDDLRLTIDSHRNFHHRVLEPEDLQ